MSVSSASTSVYAISSASDSSIGVIYPDPSSEQVNEASSQQSSGKGFQIPRSIPREDVHESIQRANSSLGKSPAADDLARKISDLTVSDRAEEDKIAKIETIKDKRDLSKLLSSSSKSSTRAPSKSDPSSSSLSYTSLSYSTGRVPSARKHPKSEPASNSVDTNKSPRAEAQIAVQRFEDNNFNDVGSIDSLDSKVLIALYNKVCDICGQQNASSAAAAASSKRSEKVQNAETIRTRIEDFWKTSREKKLIQKIHNDPEFRSKLAHLSFCLLPSQELFSIMKEFIRSNAQENILPVQSIMTFIVDWLNYFKNTTELHRVTQYLKEIVQLSENIDFLQESHTIIKGEVETPTGTPFTNNTIPSVEKHDLTEAKLRLLQEKCIKLTPQELFSLYYFEETELILARSIVLHKAIVKTVKDLYERLKETDTVKKFGIPRTVHPRQDFINEIYKLEKTCLKNHDYASSYALLLALKELQPQQKEQEKISKKIESIIFAQDKPVAKASPIPSILLLHEKIHKLKDEVPDYCAENDFNYGRLEKFVELFSRHQ